MLNHEQKKKIFMQWVKEGNNARSFLGFCRDVDRNYRTVKKIIDEGKKKLETMKISITDVDAVRRNIDKIVEPTVYRSKPTKITEDLKEIIRAEINDANNKKNMTERWLKLRETHGDKKMVSYNEFRRLAKQIQRKK